MAYSTSNPPHLQTQGLGNQVPARWTYTSTDTATDVDAAGYITNGHHLGLKAGDTVDVLDNNATPPITTRHTVVTVNATTGAVDLSNADGSNSD